MSPGGSAKDPGYGAYAVYEAHLPNVNEKAFSWGTNAAAIAMAIRAATAGLSRVEDRAALSDSPPSLDILIIFLFLRYLIFHFIMAAA
jgi:hypothetical protein